MRGKLRIASLVGTLAAVVAVSAWPVDPALAAKKLTYGSYVPAPHLIHKYGLKPFFKRVEKATNGALDFELFVGGAMGGPKESLQSIRDNVVDSALVVDVYLKRDLPVSVTLADLFLLNDDPLVFAAAENQTQLLDCPQCDKERKKHNVKALAYYSTGTFHLMCRRPINTLADVQGVKIRASSRLGVWAKAMGAVPVSVTTAEMYEALQRGQAECTLGSLAWLNSYNLKDLITSIVDAPMGAYFAALVYDMNQGVWDGLSDAERQAIIKNLPKLVADITYTYVADGVNAMKAAQAKGAKVSPADKPMLDRLAEHRKGEYKAAAAKARKAGVKNPEKLLDTFLANVAKWRKIVKDIGRDKAKYEQALWREIYSKLK